MCFASAFGPRIGYLDIQPISFAKRTRKKLYLKQVFRVSTIMTFAPPAKTSCVYDGSMINDILEFDG